MDDERWDDLVDMIDERFGIVKNEKTNVPRRDGSPEWHDAVIFEKGGRRMKLERISRPRVLDVKTYYARRRSGNVREEVTYSETERTHTVRLYEWNGDWVEVDLTAISR
ncbi:MAG TPA: hypothetical protein PLU39_00885 [Armatimonadota bacterium]|jgi:hypothetical protein|nr:hypothetical protein [Armatimonadota bacterium]HOJ20075.1 hypothetical protein [Armatimonadota bacterium]HOM80602.1 hypothetical protein [Armatimonadota bacterium]HOQ27600.1 hypothetical protein [Armatimonadota bacterium]HPO73514.1 hypothetical protein [Armatimonadota bacterium]